MVSEGGQVGGQVFGVEGLDGSGFWDISMYQVEG